MFRIMLTAMLFVATLSIAPAQTMDQIEGSMAVQAMMLSRKAAHAVTLDSATPTRLVGEAAAAVSSLPAEYRGQLDQDIVKLRAALGVAATQHAKGDVYTSVADGGHTVVLARAGTGNWSGVAVVADAVTANYYKAYGQYVSAGFGYGAVADRARDIKQVVKEIQDYISMLDAFNAFYDPQ